MERYCFCLNLRSRASSCEVVKGVRGLRLVLCFLRGQVLGLSWPASGQRRGRSQGQPCRQRRLLCERPPPKGVTSATKIKRAMPVTKYVYCSKLLHTNIISRETVNLELPFQTTSFQLPKSSQFVKISAHYVYYVGSRVLCVFATSAHTHMPQKTSMFSIEDANAMLGNTVFYNPRNIYYASQ